MIWTSVMNTGNLRGTISRRMHGTRGIDIVPV